MRPLEEIAEEEEFEGGEIEFESVDQIVVTQLDTIESNTVDKTAPLYGIFKSSFIDLCLINNQDCQSLSNTGNLS